MTSVFDWLEQSVENNDIELIKFDSLKLDVKKHKKGGIPSRPCVYLNDLKFTYHNMTDYDDINIYEKQMGTIFSVGLEHENIIKAFISQSERSLEYYLLVEVANQGNLTNYLKTGLTWDQRINIASQLISGLEFLHNQQIIHSSLNPKNVFFHNDILKITNFGGLPIFKSDDFENIPYVEPQALTLEKGFIKSSCGKDDNSSNIFDKRPDCSMALKRLANVDLKEVISSELDKDIYYKDIDDYITKSRRNHSTPSLYGGSTIVGTLIDDSSNIRTISQNSPDHINKFLLQQWNLHKGLKVHGNAFIHGEEILTENGTIISQEVNRIHVYKNKSSNPFDILKNRSVSKQILEEINICLHVRLLNVEYKNFEVSNGFSREIEDVLKNQDKESIRKALQKTFEKYGDYIPTNVVIGGALRIKSACPKDRMSFMQDIETLKANLYWVNEQIFSGHSNIFDKIPFDNIFTIEDLDSNQRITSGLELEAWMEEFYEHKKGYVIAFNEIIPAYTLLKDEIKQEIIKVCGRLQRVNIEHMIVPYIIKTPIPDDLNNWTKKKNSPIIYLCHWISNLYFQYGLIIQQNNIRHGLEVAIDFLEIPEICLLDKSYMYLRQPLNKKEAFILANRIKIDNINLAEIPFLAESLANNDHPILDDRQKSNEIHCFIVSEKIKLTFNMNKIRPSENFLNAVDEALKSNYPFRNLKNVFDKFGYLCPRNIILGRTFSKIYEPDNNEILVDDEYIFSIDNDESEIVEEKLEKWNKVARKLDVLFFLDFNGDIVR
ncbi:24359_t:CDS:2, partial [Dentiscutata erythropus]